MSGQLVSDVWVHRPCQTHRRTCPRISVPETPLPLSVGGTCDWAKQVPGGRAGKWMRKELAQAGPKAEHFHEQVAPGLPVPPGASSLLPVAASSWGLLCGTFRGTDLRITYSTPEDSHSTGAAGAKRGSSRRRNLEPCTCPLLGNAGCLAHAETQTFVNKSVMETWRTRCGEERCLPGQPPSSAGPGQPADKTAVGSSSSLSEDGDGRLPGHHGVTDQAPLGARGSHQGAGKELGSRRVRREWLAPLLPELEVGSLSRFCLEKHKCFLSLSLCLSPHSCCPELL